MDSLIGRLVISGLGGMMVVAGAWVLKMSWPLWRTGVETRATVVRAYTPYLGDVRFEDREGQVHLIEKTSPPRFGQFVQGQTRVLTYLPSKPALWDWHDRKHQSASVLPGAVLVTGGLFLLVSAWTV